MKNYQFYYNLNGSLDKPLVLFLHGFMGNTHEFDQAIQLLSDKFCCLTVDLPGHGKTDILGSDRDYSMANTAQALIDLLDELQVNRCFLVGYSMGGRLALYLTLFYPQRFLQVVLESASPGLKTEAERLARVKWDEQIARKLTKITQKSKFAAFLFYWYTQPVFGNIKYHPQFDLLLEIRLQNNPVELAKSLRFMGTGCQPSLWPKIPENQIPILLLTGELDQKFIDINRKMAQSGKSQLKIINNTGHNIHWENPLAFAECVQDFFLINGEC